MADCTLASLVAASKCYNCLSDTEKKAATVYFLALAVQANGGPDLRNVNDLNNAVKCLACAPKDTRRSFDVTVAQRAATNAGASATLTITQLRAAIKCLVCDNPNLVDAAETYLRCQLNDSIS